MNQITPEQLFMIIGEITVENRILRQQMIELNKSLEKKEEVTEKKRKLRSKRS